MRPTFRQCGSCGSSHLGPVPCGMTFGQRMKTTKVDWTGMPAHQMHNYYDKAAVEKTFGHDATDRLYDNTEGIGVVQQDNRGQWWHKSRNKEPERMTEKQMDVMAGANNETVL